MRNETHHEADAFLLTDGRLTKIDRGEGVSQVSAHGIDERGLISGRYGDVFATWRIGDLDSHRARAVPFRGGEPRECYLGTGGLLSGNVASVQGDGYVRDVFRLRRGWSARLLVESGHYYTCWSAVGEYATAEVETAQGSVGVLWDGHQTIHTIPGMTMPVEVNQAGLVAGYAHDQGLTRGLIWHHGKVVGRLDVADSDDNIVILGVTGRGEVFGRYERGTGQVKQTLWSRR